MAWRCKRIERKQQGSLNQNHVLDPRLCELCFVVDGMVMDDYWSCPDEVEAGESGH